MVERERIESHIRALQGVRHPVAAPQALERAADYVAAQLAAPGYAVTEHLFPDGGRLHRNLLATCRGLLRPDERVLLLAHYDTVAASPGADDNASGVAVLLEAAALLAPLRFARTVQLVAVSLEENAQEDERGSGLRGSRALAERARAEGWQIAGVAVLESVAYAGAEVAQSAPPGVPVPVPETGDFLAVVGNECSRGLVEAFARAAARPEIALPLFPLAVPGNGELLPDTRRSDHAPFWDAGYEAIMLTDTTNFRNPHYHRPSDTLETLNLDFAALVCRATVEFVRELAGVVP